MARVDRSCCSARQSRSLQPFNLLAMLGCSCAVQVQAVEAGALPCLVSLLACPDQSIVADIPSALCWLSEALPQASNRAAAGGQLAAAAAPLVQLLQDPSRPGKDDVVVALGKLGAAGGPGASLPGPLHPCCCLTTRGHNKAGCMHAQLQEPLPHPASGALQLCTES
jgi:hypothetical protein